MKVFVLALAIFSFFGNSFANQSCSEPYVDNATFFASDSLAGEKNFSESDTLTFVTKQNHVCAGKGAMNSEGFAIPIFKNDDVVKTNQITGAVEGEKFMVNKNGNAAVVTFSSEKDIPIEKNTNVYESGAIYELADIRSLGDSSKIGFEQDTLYAQADSASVNVDVTLPESDSLTGLQFDVALQEYSGSDPTVVASHGKGTLETNKISPDTLRAILFLGVNDDADQLPKDDVVEIGVDNVSSGPQSLSLSNAIASLNTQEGVQSSVSYGISTTDPTKNSDNNFITEEVDLSIGTSPVTFIKTEQLLIAEKDSVTFEETTVGNESEDSVKVENISWEGLLVETQIDNPLVFNAEDSVFVSSSSFENVDVSFSPTRTNFGKRTTGLSLSATEDTAQVLLLGTGVGGRGDPTLDGTVNITDVTQTSEIILEETDYSDEAFVAADVFPVEEEGDGSVTVTDLQTTVNAILTETWGDGEDIPKNLQSISSEPEQVEKQKLVLREVEADKTALIAKNVETSKGIQASFDVAGTFNVNTHKEFVVKSGSPRSGETKVVIYKQSGNPLEESEIQLGSFNQKLEDIEPISAASVEGNRAVEVTAEKKEGTYENSINVHPNPSSREATIDIQLQEKQDARLVVYDVLGRRVQVIEDREFKSGASKIEFNVHNLSSGTYFVRFNGESFTQDIKITVVR